VTLAWATNAWPTLPAGANSLKVGYHCELAGRAPVPPRAAREEEPRWARFRVLPEKAEQDITRECAHESCSNDPAKEGRMRFQLAMLGFFVAVAGPLVGYAQYDIVSGSIREEHVALNNGDSARRQTFLISSRKVVLYKNFVATLIRDEQTGVLWFAVEGANTQTAQPSGDWIVAKSKDGRSLVGFQASSSKLFIRASNRTAGSMDSARALAMTELSAEIGGWEANLVKAPEIALSPHLDLSTFSGALGLSPRDIRRVTGTDGGWLVELASHPTLAKTAFVYLSQDFKVLKLEVRNN